MIREEELNEAIARCQGDQNPNADTCIKLASYYTIKDHMYSRPAAHKESPAAYKESGYAYSAPPVTSYTSESEFGQLIANIDPVQVLTVIDDLMRALSVLNPPLYKSVIRNIGQYKKP